MHAVKYVRELEANQNHKSKFVKEDNDCNEINMNDEHYFNKKCKLFK